MKYERLISFQTEDWIYRERKIDQYNEYTDWCFEIFKKWVNKVVSESFFLQREIEKVYLGWTKWLAGYKPSSKILEQVRKSTSCDSTFQSDLMQFLFSMDQYLQILT